MQERQVGVMADTCLMSATDPRCNQPGDPFVPCEEPAIATITFGCGHEHVDRTLACAGCAAEIQQLAGVLACPRCEDGPQPHECKAAAVIEWFSGEVTHVR
jgi:hypothetical protein